MRHHTIARIAARLHPSCPTLYAMRGPRPGQPGAAGFVGFALRGGPRLSVADIAGALRTTRGESAPLPTDLAYDLA